MAQQLQQGAADAEAAVRAVFAAIAIRCRGGATALLRARGDDIDDLARRLLLSLRGLHAHVLEHLPPGTVLVARHLYPSDTVYLMRASTVAVVAEFAGPAAHAALLARELGIPCVGGIADLMDHIQPADELIIDGSRGTVMVTPDAIAIAEHTAAIAEGVLARHRPSRIGRHGIATRDGQPVQYWRTPAAARTSRSPCRAVPRASGCSASSRSTSPASTCPPPRS